MNNCNKAENISEFSYHNGQKIETDRFLAIYIEKLKIDKQQILSWQKVKIQGKT